MSTKFYKKIGVSHDKGRDDEFVGGHIPKDLLYEIRLRQLFTGDTFSKILRTSLHAWQDMSLQCLLDNAITHIQSIWNRKKTSEENCQFQEFKEKISDELLKNKFKKEHIIKIINKIKE